MSTRIEFCEEEEGAGAEIHEKFSFHSLWTCRKYNLIVEKVVDGIS
jgi:hypothetical protein